MNCPEAKERLSALIDGALAPAEEAEVRRHVDGCEACREELSGLAAVVDLVREIPAPRVPDGFRRDVVARLPRRRSPTPLRWLVPLAAAACLLLLARLMITNRAMPEVLDVATHEAGPEGLATAPPEAVSAEEPEPLSKGARDKESDGYYEKEEAERLGNDPAPSEGDAGEPVLKTREVPDPETTDETTASDVPPGRREPGDMPKAPIARKYAVHGAEPDAAAGVILAELSYRRTRSRKSTPGGESVVQGGSGEVAGIILHLTPEEIEFVTCLLEERPGVRVDRVNGGAKSGEPVKNKKVPAAPGKARKDEPKAADPDSGDADDAAEAGRLVVELRFR